MAVSLSECFTRWRIGTSGLLILVTTVPAFGQGLEDIDPFGDTPAAEQAADDPFGVPGFADEAPVPGLDGADGAEEPETRESVLEKAKGFAADEDWKSAISELSKVLAQNSRDGEFAFERAIAFKELGNDQLAMQDFEVAATYGGPFEGVTESALKNLAELKLDQGQVQEAVDDIDQAIRLNPTDGELLFLRGKALVRLVRILGQQGVEQLTDAKTTLDRAIESDPENAEAYIERSNVFQLQNQLLGQNRLDRAIADAEMAVQKDSETPNTKARSGLAFLTRASSEKNRYNADMDQVVSDFARAAEMFSGHLMVEGEKTEEDYEEASPDTLTSGQVYLYRAVANLGIATNSSSADKHSLYQSVIFDCDKALEFNPDTVEALYQKGVAQRLSGDLEAAIDSFTDSLDLAAGFNEARLRRGIAYYYLDDMSLARGDFERCQESQADGRAAFWIGVTYAREGEYNDAVRYYTQAIRENPSYKPAYSNRALAYMKTNRFRQAESDYNELIRRDRNDSVARERRDVARAQAGY
jgi:tetratricopeptide (TPR) repeat protein